MPNIHVLTQEVIGKIAAGEVVERPAAAIKEMVENSLDAGATAVTVEIRDGGISYIRVTDNGSGIAGGDIRLAFERHATSKITREEDLTGIQTLGFRGEALASIAAVAKVTCTTRTKDEPVGLKDVNEGGRLLSVEETACPQGTAMVVKELFYNTPVRLKFLKKPVTEAGYVSDYMMRLILSRPDVSFRYISNGKVLYHSAGDGRLASAVFSIYGNEMLNGMRFVRGYGAGMAVEGYVGIGDTARGNRAQQSFFINGRYTRSTVLSGALESACRERVMIGKYPTCVLHLTMPYELVDVNVHPNKLDVRFQDDAAIAAALEAIVRDGIHDRDALEHPSVMKLTPEEPAVTPVSVMKTETAVPQTAQAEQPVKPAAPAPLPEKPFVPPAVTFAAPPAAKAAPVMRETPAPQERYAAQPAPAAPQRAETPSFLPEAPKPMRVIGVAFKTYILVEYEDQLLMIDQHAVHERLLFDQLSAAWDQHTAAQELMIPLVVSVTQREQAVIEENLRLLEAVGLTVEPFGEREVSIRTVPMILGEPQAEAFLHEALDELMSDRGLLTVDKRRAAILQTACKHAIKGGDSLTEAEIRDLITRMIEQKVTPTCPHGRPLVVSLTRTELEKKFHRIQ